MYTYIVSYIYREIYIYIYLTSFNICFWGHSKLLLKKRHRPKPFFFSSEVAESAASVAGTCSRVRGASCGAPGAHRDDRSLE